MNRPPSGTKKKIGVSHVKRILRRAVGGRFTTQEIVESLYQALLERPPDPEGFASYARSLQRGASLTDVVRSFVQSDEYRGALAVRCFVESDEYRGAVEGYVTGRTSSPGFTLEEVIESLCEGLLTRAPDPEGFAAYVRALENGEPPVDAVRKFVNAEECIRESVGMPKLGVGEHDVVSSAGDDQVVRRASDLAVTMLQSCDLTRYLPLLACGRAANERYAVANGFSYSTFVGIKRGYFPWHACFNRLFMLKELAVAGYRGWVFYLDADAFVYGQSFDLRTYLVSHRDKSFIAAEGGPTGLPWDINDGVFLLNLGHPDGLKLANLWHRNFMATPEAALREAREWEDVPSDQPRLHKILMEKPRLMKHMLVEKRHFLNDSGATFVRQILRGDGTVDDRVRIMQGHLASIGIRS